MRYYNIAVKNADGTPYRTFTSFPNGKVDMGALQVVLDITVVAYATADQNSYVQIWGVGLKDIAQASDFNNKLIEVSAGMQAGLPLANPAQAGMLVSGSIKQAFGNWVGTAQTLDLLIGPVVGTNDANLNFSIDWKAGQKLSDAIGSTLKVTFPKLKQSISISDNLVLAYDSPGTYGTLQQFAQHVREISKSIVNTDGYAGVDILMRPDSVVVLDGTSATSPRVIAFQDLLGQPTWGAPGEISFQCPMRADVFPGDFVQLPKSPQTVSAAAMTQYRNASAQQGIFIIKQARHVGAFRQPDGSGWSTTYEAYKAAPAT